MILASKSSSSLAKILEVFPRRWRAGSCSLGPPGSSSSIARRASAGGCLGAVDGGTGGAGPGRVRRHSIDHHPDQRRRPAGAQVRSRPDRRDRGDAARHPLGLRPRSGDGDAGRSGSALRLLGGDRRRHAGRARRPGPGRPRRLAERCASTTSPAACSTAPTPTATSTTASSATTGSGSSASASRPRTACVEVGLKSHEATSSRSRARAGSSFPARAGGGAPVEWLSVRAATGWVGGPLPAARRTGAPAGAPAGGGGGGVAVVARPRRPDGEDGTRRQGSPSRAASGFRDVAGRCRRGARPGPAR